MFSRNNRTDYKLFFGTRGAFRSLGWNWLVLIVYLNGVVLCIPLLSPLFLPLLGILVAIGQFVCPGAPRLVAVIYCGSSSSGSSGYFSLIRDKH
jgi:cytosine/uracil/thiamine/allantoin permease